MSEVEQFYEKIRELQGGNIPWNNLPRYHQDILMQAINIILQITSQRD